MDFRRARPPSLDEQGPPQAAIAGRVADGAGTGRHRPRRLDVVEHQQQVVLGRVVASRAGVRARTRTCRVVSPWRWLLLLKWKPQTVTPAKRCTRWRAVSPLPIVTALLHGGTPQITGSVISSPRMARHASQILRLPTSPSGVLQAASIWSYRVAGSDDWFGTMETGLEHPNSVAYSRAGCPLPSSG